MLLVTGVVFSLSLMLQVATSQSFSACYVDGVDRDHNEEWKNDTLDCVIYKCIDGKVTTIFSACVWQNKCYKVGEGWKEGCNKLKCVRYKEDHHTYFEVEAQTSCEYKSQCKPQNSTWRENCDVLQCQVDVSGNIQTAYVNREPWCKFKGKCYKNKETWTHGCGKFLCVISESKDGFTKEIKEIPSCIYDKKCFVIGSKRQESQCHVVECRVKDDMKVGWDTVTIGCVLGKSCVPVNGTSFDDKKCVTHQCARKRKGTKIIVRLKSTKTGCLLGERCIPANGTYVDEKNCIKYRCIPKKIGNNVIGHLESTRTACVHDNKCFKIGSRRKESQCHIVECQEKADMEIDWVTVVKGCLLGETCVPLNGTLVDDKNCIKHRCIPKKKGKKIIVRLKTTKTGCSYKNECIKHGSSVESPDCETFKCSGTKQKPKLTLTKTGCKDHNKKCQGYDVKFSFNVRGKVFSDCTCKKSGKNGSKTICTVASSDDDI